MSVRWVREKWKRTFISFRLLVDRAKGGPNGVRDIPPPDYIPTPTRGY